MLWISSYFAQFSADGRNVSLVALQIRDVARWPNGRSFLPNCASVVVRYDGDPMLLDTGEAVMDIREMATEYRNISTLILQNPT